MKLIAVSEKDIASKNIGEFLLSEYEFRKTQDTWDNHPVYEEEDIKLVRCSKKVLNFDYLQEFDPKILVIPSPHKSKAKIPSLTCHTPGNWSSADYGGTERTLGISPALYLRETLLGLREQERRMDSDYEVTLEVTHHGPTLEIPTMFVEIGSSKEQWNDSQACKAVATTIMNVLKEKRERVPMTVGFGGNHYAAKFTKLLFSEKFAIGHICPKYAADSLNEKMILQALKRTQPEPKKALLDWKGLKSDQRDKIIEILDRNKIEWNRA